MGVLACDRRGCENIMCDSYSHSYGYLCNDCLDELIASGSDTDIGRFMGSEPQDYRDYDNAEEKFRAEFEDRRA